MFKKSLTLALFFLILTCFNSFADKFSIANGLWSNGAIWSNVPGGPTCNCSPSSGENITINHYVTLTKHLTNVGSAQNGITAVLTINAGAILDGGNIYDIDIRSSGSLYLCGTLIIRNLILSNGSTVYVCPGGNLTVNGNFENKNNSNSIVMDGSFTVGGSYNNGNGGIIGGTGTISITNGPVENTGNTYGCEGFDPCGGFFPCTVTSPCGTLPIELLSFNAELKNNYVLLKWITATEINNDYFIIERSADGKIFENIGKINGVGTTSAFTDYIFFDEQPLHGLSYYRLRQIDFDGASSTTSPVLVKNYSVDNLYLISSPLSVSIYYSTDIVSEVIISDIMGRIYFKENISGTGILDFPISELPQGLLFIRSTSSKNQDVYKILVTH